MKQIYSAANMLDAQLLKDFLLDRGIEVIIKGELLMGAIGEIPADTTPSVWVMDDSDYEAAKSLVSAFEDPDKIISPEKTVWKCLDCDELIEPQFSQCWKCGKPRTQ